MGLDRFMGIDTEETKKKTSKKKLDVTPVRVTKKENNLPIKEESSSLKDSATVDNKIEVPPSFSFVTMHFKCTNPQCKKKKTIRKPQSFTPTEKDLVCPKCGSPLKKLRGK